MEADEVLALARRLERCEMRPFAGSYHDADFVFEVDDAALRRLATDALVAVLERPGASARARERALDGLRLQGDVASIQRGFDVPDAGTRAYAWTAAVRVLGAPGFAHWGVHAGTVKVRRVSLLPAIRSAARDEVERMFADIRVGDVAVWQAPTGRSDAEVAALEARFWDAAEQPVAVETLGALPPATRALFATFALLLVERQDPRGPALLLALGLPGGRAALESLAATATGAFGDAVREALAAPGGSSS